MLMTNQSKANFIDSVEKTLNESASEMDKLPSLFLNIEYFKTIFNEANEENADTSRLFDSLLKLLNFRLIIGIITLDLCAATLIYLRGKFQYEAIYSMRQLIVIINEGYKKIYNFVIEKNNGEKDVRHRNGSFWIKEIGALISNDFPESQPKYDEVTSKLDKYLNVNFETLKKQRDLSVHYDKESMNVYKMLIELDDEEIFNKLIPFLSIINEMFLFTNELCKKISHKADQISLGVDKKLDNLIELLEKSKTSQNEKDISEINEQLLAIKNLKIK